MYSGINQGDERLRIAHLTGSRSLTRGQATVPKDRATLPDRYDNFGRATTRRNAIGRSKPMNSSYGKSLDTRSWVAGTFLKRIGGLCVLAVFIAAASVHSQRGGQAQSTSRE